MTTDASSISSITLSLAHYVANTLDRALPDAIVTRTKMHVLDTIAAMVSGSRLKPGNLAARYVDSLGGKAQAMVIGAGIVTSSVNAAFANAIAAHSDETDDTNPQGPVHLGCCVVPAALAAGEAIGGTGADLVRAVAVGYDLGARVNASFGLDQHSPRHHPACLSTTYAATAAASAMLRLNSSQVRHALSYATQQASGIGIWKRDPDHIEKAFDFGGMGARNGVMAATMVAFGFTGVEDPFGGDPNAFFALGNSPKPEKLIDDLGVKFAVTGTTIKKWSVGSPLLSVLDGVTELLKDPAVRADNVSRVIVHVPTYTTSIIDNAASSNLCLQHLVALMIVDGGASFTSVHDAARMTDPRVLAIRKLVEVEPSRELQAAKPERQSIVQIETADGRWLKHHAYVVRGTARNPMDADELEAKALDLMAPVFGVVRAREVITAVNNLESFGRLSNLRPLLLL